MNTLELLDAKFDLDVNAITKQEIEKLKQFQDFFSRHCQVRNNTFQIKKCPSEDVDNYWYCVMQPPRMGEESYAELSLLPDLMKDSISGRFESFKDLYGTETNENCSPSLATMMERQNPVDQKNKSVLVAAKVCVVIDCNECSNPHYIYSTTQLTAPEKKTVDRVKAADTYIYTCGSPLLLEGSSHSNIIVKEGLK